MAGWIKIHRQIQDHWIYKSKDPFTQREAWIDILLKVNHSTQKVNIGNELLVCDCGESLNSLDTWAKRWRWTKSKVRRFFKLLESDSMIVTKSERKTTRLTVCNYSKYQVERIANETQTKRKRNASETQTTPNKNEENDKNDKNEKTSLKEFGFSEAVVSILEEYKKNLHGLGKGYKKTEIGWKRFYSKTKKFIGLYGEPATIGLIEKSLDNNWKDIFDDDLKKSQTTPAQRQQQNQTNQSYQVENIIIQ